MRWVVGVVIALFVVALGFIQVASDAFAHRAAAAGTFPQRVSVRLGWRVYRVLDRLAPAAYVETTLAQDALARGDFDAAQRNALRLPASPIRDDLLARIAQMRGESLLALEYFLAAPDPEAVQAFVEARAVHDPAQGYELERLLEARLALSSTHPDAVAEAYWRMGMLANREAWLQVSGSTKQLDWLRHGLRDFESAVNISPLSEQYVMAAANQEDLIGSRRSAEELFRRASAIDPESADAIAGLGVIALESGDRTKAELYLQQARAVDPRSLMVRALDHDLTTGRVTKGPIK